MSMIDMLAPRIQTKLKDFWRFLINKINIYDTPLKKKDGNKELAFLDVKIKNNEKGQYDFNIFRKNAITKVQVKPESCHDPGIQEGVL